MNYNFFKKIITLFYKKKKIVPVWCSSMTFNKFFLKKYVKVSKGLFFRIFKVNNYMLGRKAGMYVSTRKPFKKPISLKQKRR